MVFCLTCKNKRLRSLACSGVAVSNIKLTFAWPMFFYKVVLMLKFGRDACFLLFAHKIWSEPVSQVCMLIFFLSHVLGIGGPDRIYMTVWRFSEDKRCFVTILARRMMGKGGSQSYLTGIWMDFSLSRSVELWEWIA